MDLLELKIPPPIQALLFSVAMWFTSAQFSSFAFVFPWHHALGILLVIVGIALGVVGAITFRRAKTTVNPTKPGEASSLVTSGIYRLSRNPMYVGLLVVLIGWALWLSNPLAFLFLPFFVAYMTRFQIIPEERVLSAKFGAEYAVYKQSVRRWL